MKKLLCSIIAFVAVASSYTQNDQIARGHEPGEIYMTSIWYEPSLWEERYDAIFYSSDNGETIGIRYAQEVYSSEMPIADITSDATPGVLYNSYQKNLWISYSYAYSWNKLDPPGNHTNLYTAGTTEGEIYIRSAVQDVKLSRSTDFGENFTLVNNNPQGGRAEVGTEANEIYIRYAPGGFDDSLKIYFSNNAGVDFTLQSELDSTIGGYVISGKYPVISRGTSPGELYLVTWHYPDVFHIYYSTDYGQSFEQRYVSGSCNLYYRYSFTAGVQPGSYYVKYSIPWVDGVNTEMHILYSSDTAKTFTEYIHFLDANFPVLVQENQSENDPNNVSVYPNPFSDYLNMAFTVEQKEYVLLNIYSTYGMLIRTLFYGVKDKGMYKMEWDGKDKRGREVENGFYYLRTVFGNKSKTVKILKSKNAERL